MNELSRLIHQQRESLGLTWEELAKRGGFKGHSVIYTLATKREHKSPPRPETLKKLAKALDVPLDVVRAAAVEAAGYTLQEIPTTLEAANQVRIVAVAMQQMSAKDRAKLTRMAQAFLDEVGDDEAAEQS